ncbi:phosphotransferase family protein [Salinivibrio proteolyticus]|uniref:Phosphotransferase n=1 Tax=Salinivibrio proteolyticus TaxID=334715 RepID=A0ABY7LEP0_9GAMM|nr:phosphotransferase [Salinivibrio proteolyticus]WBA15568.1 phosphotransferase [Salinivibrio proteolyticus]
MTNKDVVLVLKNLAQMGEASVYRSMYQGRACITKTHATLVERDFYCSAAPYVNAVGVNTPALFEVRETTLCMEWIPHAVSIEELAQDTNTFEQLARLHGVERPIQPHFKHHQWSLPQTQSALEQLSLTPELESMLYQLQQRSDVLFTPRCVLSGDTNPGNWGRREDGTLVLFDWERFGQGSPAIDLAPLVAGMGDKSAYQAIIARYKAANPSVDSHSLFVELVLAKAWIVIEVVNLLTQRGTPNRDRYLNWYNSVLPQWLPHAFRWASLAESLR